MDHGWRGSHGSVRSASAVVHSKPDDQEQLMIFDPLYFILLAPGLLLAAWASWRTHSAFNEGKTLLARRRISGAEAAAEVLHTAGVKGVAIEPVQGFLSDHYDPRHKVLRLSPDVYAGRSLSALGVAAHEAGHAIQDATRYVPLVVRNALVPLASIGSNAAWIIIMIGFLMMAAEPLLGRNIVLIGCGAFSLAVLFQLVNLPVEFDASRRARFMLVNYGIITPEEDVVVKKVLNAAAMTYVAGTLTAILTLLYFLIRAGVIGGRSSD
jgi:Zn-dependent membrane protease YugP